METELSKKNYVSFEERQRQCMLALVRDILSDKSIAQVTVENQHGAISVARTVPETRDVCAIGFTANFDEDDYDEEEGE